MEAEGVRTRARSASRSGIRELCCAGRNAAENRIAAAIFRIGFRIVAGNREWKWFIFRLWKMLYPCSMPRLPDLRENTAYGGVTVNSTSEVCVIWLV